MHRDSERHKLFNRRTTILAAGKLMLLGALTGRLYYLQVIESDKYITLADENRINFRLLPPQRGRIIDRNGYPIADNQQNYRVLLILEDTLSLDGTLSALERVIPLSDIEKRRIRRDVKRNKSFVPVTVRENLEWQEVSQIEVNRPDLPGIFIDVGESRYYPYAHEFAHVLGYVAIVSPGENTGDPLLELPGFRIGKAGVEKTYDLLLRGSGGNSQVEVNAYGRIIRELSRQEGIPGMELQLTLDVQLQQFTAKRIASKSATVVVMDALNGEILTLISNPSFDPNRFTQGLSSPEWQALINNPRAPLINKSIQGQYAPGSTFKMIVALAALEHGIIRPDTHYFCNGKMELGNAEFHCWLKDGHGSMDCVNAITQSCDVFFYEVAKRVGIERISEMANRMGFGIPLGIDLPGERSGLIPTPEWKKKTIGSSWQQGETVILGIGQGYILSTPLQLATMVSRLVNGGIAVKPSLTPQRNKSGSVDSSVDIPKIDNVGVSPTNLKLIREAMGRVVNNPYGTAFQSRITPSSNAMGGKTGTVQVRRISKVEREQGVLKNEDLEWSDRDHALFVGYAPLDSPRFAISVVVEHGGSGSSVAAPIARDILQEVQRLHINLPESAAVAVSPRGNIREAIFSSDSEYG